MPSLNQNINLKEKNVIIADVDDTICETCHLISEEMTEQVSKMIKEGYIFAFISGTKLSYLLEMISSRLKDKHFLLATTGTRCVEIDTGHENNEIYSYVLSQDERKEILTALETLTEEFNIQSLTTKEDQIQDRNSQITLSAIGRNAQLELKKKHDPDGKKREQWVKFLKTILDENKYEMNIAGTTSIDITKKGLDKEWGIRKFAEYYSIPLNSILFFGDKIYPGGNDYSASKIVDCISVKNPQETLQKLKEVREINKWSKINNLDLKFQNFPR